MALVRAGEHRVVAYDDNHSVALRAVERGAAHAAASSIAEAVSGSGIVFVAVPVGVIAATALEAARSVAGGIITDVGSTKGRVVLDIETSLPPGTNFVGGHPMAGSEADGIEAASADLFEGSWWILTPTEHSNPSSYRDLHQLLTGIGARVMAVDPETHDEMMSVISHVPQLAASALMNLASGRATTTPGMLQLAAGGFRDVTRVAASSPGVWIDICRDNPTAIAGTLTELVDSLASLRDLVLTENVSALEEYLTQARDARRGLQAGVVKGDPWEVQVPVSDQPGILARVTTTVGNLGINIEDLQIIHSTQGGRGTLHLIISGESQAQRTVEALRRSNIEAKIFRL